MFISWTNSKQIKIGFCTSGFIWRNCSKYITRDSGEINEQEQGIEGRMYIMPMGWASGHHRPLFDPVCHSVLAFCCCCNKTSVLLVYLFIIVSTSHCLNIVINLVSWWCRNSKFVLQICIGCFKFFPLPYKTWNQLIDFYKTPTGWLG